MTLEQVNKIGIECEQLGDWEYKTPDGCTHEDLECAIWNGIFGFCMCGDPNEQLETIYQCLKTIRLEWKKGGNAWDMLATDDSKYDIYLYLLDKHGFIEHNRMIYDSYLTEEGEALMYVLRNILEHDIEDAEL